MMVPSTTGVEDFQQQQQQQPFHQLHHHDHGVPSVHSIAAVVVGGTSLSPASENNTAASAAATGDLPPRNLASMLTPLKCAAPTPLTTTMTPTCTFNAPTPLTTTMTPTSNAAGFESGRTMAATSVAGKTCPQQRQQQQQQQLNPHQQQQDNGTQITSLVSRFSTGFSGLTNSTTKQQQQQHLHKTLVGSTSSELGEPIAVIGQQQQQLQQQQQQNIAVNDISSVSICSALIKESFDVLSRPSLLTMSV